MSSLIEHADRVDKARAADVARLTAIFNEEVACEHRGHNLPELAGEHGGPGKYILVLCHVSMIVCGPLRDALVIAGGAKCLVCYRHPVTAANLIEL